MKPEAWKVDSGDGVLQEGTVGGVGEHCKLPQRHSGAETPENLKFGATWDLKIHYRNAL